MVSDSEYVVSTGDWPAGARDDDPTIEEVYAVLDRVPEFYPAAMASLAQTPLPNPGEEQTT